MNNTNATRTPAARTTSSRRRWFIGGMAAVLLAAAVILWQRRESADGQQGSGAKSSANAGAMAGMPGMTSQPPGDTAAGASANLTADQIRQFGVTFGVVKTRELTDQVRATAIVTVDSSRLVQVSPRFGGFVERLYVNASGQSVRRGQPLMSIYSPELVAAEQELLVAANLQRTVEHSDIPGVPAGSTDLVAAARQRLALWDITETQISDILRSGRVRRTLMLFAPASGVILDKNVVQGQAIQPGQMLYTIADLSSVWLDTQIREADAGSVRAGARAIVQTSAAPGKPVTGHVTYVYPTLDPLTRTLRARVSVSNVNAGANALRPGMYATVALSSPSRSALTVPASAVVRTGERNIVFVDAGGGTLRPVNVALGRTAGDFTEVLAGLSSGQRVATSAQFLLDAESNLGDVMRGMISQGSGATSGTASNMSNMPGMTPAPSAATQPPRR